MEAREKIVKYFKDLLLCLINFLLKEKSVKK